MAHLNCPKCNEPLHESDFQFNGIAGGTGELDVYPSLDIICDCPHCEAKLYAMVPQTALMVVG